jgi:ferritin
MKPPGEASAQAGDAPTGDAPAAAAGGPGLDTPHPLPGPHLQPPPREPYVIGKRLRRLLTRQVGAELAGQQAYVGMSLYFERQSLARWARIFGQRSAEEAAHAARIMEFLAANQVEFNLPRVPGAPTRFKSPARAVREALDHEGMMLTRANALARTASKGGAETLPVIQWLVERHAEGEREARRLADLIASGINLFQAETLLDECAQEPGRAAATRSSGAGGS